jgi:hypothetical protein
MSSRSLIVLFATLATSLSVAAPASADVIKVPSDVSTIQGALDLAQPFDVVLVDPGSYGEILELHGKGVSLVADGGTVDTKYLDVRHVPAGQSVVVSGFSLDMPTTEPGFFPSFYARDNQGTLRLSDCDFTGDPGVPGSWMTGAPALPGTTAAIVVNSDSVSFIDCQFFGGWGAWLDDEDFESFATNGGPGLEVTNATVTAFGCHAVGGTGGSITDTVTSSGGSGGPGILAREGALVEVHGSTLEGGHGGFADCDFFAGICGSGGSGGDGIRLFDAGTHAISRDNDFQPGTGGSNGDQGSGPDGDDIDHGFSGSTSETYPAGYRSLELNTPVREAGTLTVSVTGEVGDTVLLFAGLSGAQYPFAKFQGVFLLDFPLVIESVPVGVIPGSGSLDIPLVIPELGPGLEAVDVHVQIVVDDGAGVLIGPAQVTTLLDGAF